MNSLKSTLFLVLSLFFTSYASAQLASVQNGCAPLTVEFNASGNPTSFFWTLGDGNTSLEPSPTYIYQNQELMLSNFDW
ncbi:MAG: PKD domain-containing protein [Saprospiraceae bacterium]